MKCTVCGCTDSNCAGCVERTGRPCCWVGPRLCSACVGRAKAARTVAGQIVRRLATYKGRAPRHALSAFIGLGFDRAMVALVLAGLVGASGRGRNRSYALTEFAREYLNDGPDRVYTSPESQP